VRVSFEPFADTRGGTGVAVLESTRQILQQTSSGREVHLFVGADDDRADPRSLALGQRFQNVSKLVHMTPMNQRSRTKRLRHRLVQRLRAI
jgi:hypothetical protein